MPPRKKIQPEPDTFKAGCVWGWMNELELVVSVVEAQDGERRKRMLDLLTIGLQRFISEDRPAAVDFGAALAVYDDVRDDDEAARW